MFTPRLNLAISNGFPLAFMCSPRMAGAMKFFLVPTFGEHWPPSLAIVGVILKVSEFNFRGGRFEDLFSGIFWIFLNFLGYFQFSACLALSPTTWWTSWSARSDLCPVSWMIHWVIECHWAILGLLSSLVHHLTCAQHWVPGGYPNSSWSQLEIMEEHLGSCRLIPPVNEESSQERTDPGGAGEQMPCGDPCVAASWFNVIPNPLLVWSPTVLV